MTRRFLSARGIEPAIGLALVRVLVAGALISRATQSAHETHDEWVAPVKRRAFLGPGDGSTDVSRPSGTVSHVL